MINSGKERRTLFRRYKLKRKVQCRHRRILYGCLTDIPLHQRDSYIGTVFVENALAVVDHRRRIIDGDNTRALFRHVLRHRQRGRPQRATEVIASRVRANKPRCQFTTLLHDGCIPRDRSRNHVSENVSYALIENKPSGFLLRCGEQLIASLLSQLVCSVSNVHEI